MPALSETCSTVNFCSGFILLVKMHVAILKLTVVNFVSLIQYSNNYEMPRPMTVSVIHKTAKIYVCRSMGLQVAVKVRFEVGKGSIT